MAKRQLQTAKAAVAIAQLGGIEKTPDPPSRVDYVPRTKGQTSGLGICMFWSAMFKANGALPKTKKMTDEEIKRKVIGEFPAENQPPRTQSFLGKLGEVGQKGTVTVNAQRIMYNNGKLTSGNVPDKVSVRYNEDGEVVNGRTGKVHRRTTEGSEN